MENKKTTIGINASFLRKPTTGIGQVTTNFLRELIRLEGKNENLKIILYLEEDLPKNIKLPKNSASSASRFEKRIFLPLWKRDDLIRKIWWEKYLLPRRAKKDGCDIFFSLYQCPAVMPRDMKHIMLVHDIVPRLFPEYQGNFRKKLYQHLIEKAVPETDRIIANSKRTEKDLIEHYGIKADKITVSYLDVDDIFRNPVSDKTNARVLKKYKLKPGYILAGGGLEIRKNIEGVIRSYNFLLEKKFVTDLPDLVIYGKLLPGNPLALDAQKLIKELNLTKRVKLLDMVPQEFMPTLFRNSILFIYPSFYEGFGIPVLEAMNMGKPVITSKNSSLPEVGGDSVLYCQPDDIYDIAMVIKNVLGNEELRKQLSLRAHARAKMFSWEKFTRKFLNIALEI